MIDNLLDTHVIQPLPVYYRHNWTKVLENRCLQVDQISSRILTSPILVHRLFGMD